MNTNLLINNLKTHNIEFLIIGSHALYLLNQKFNLGIDIDLKTKDLDFIVKDNDNFSEFVERFQIPKIQQKNLTMHKISSSQHGIDLITKVSFRHLKINDHIILGLDYENIKDYCYTGELYDHNVNFINLEAYYGIVKNTGFKKYKTIIQKILEKYPNLKDTVIA
jgi:hypothetical protein